MSAIRLAAFDNDGTLHPAKGVWEYLQQPLGLYEGDGERLLKAHLNGEMSYSELIRQSVARWEGRPAADFRGVIDGLPLRDGVLELLAELKRLEIPVVIFSSGVHWWEECWREKYGVSFARYRANVPEVDDAGFCTGGVDIRVTDDAPETNKGTLLRLVQEEWGIAPEATLALGDGRGDIPMFRQSGRSFCVSPSAGVCEATTDGEVPGGDLRALLQYL